MLFNLSCCRHFPTKQTGEEILCSRVLGPCFSGGDGSELTAYDEPFNGVGNCYSYANYPGYGIPVDAQGINTLTNKEGGKFTISELEVWEVTYQVSKY